MAEVYRTSGQAVQDRYDSIETCLKEVIAPLPKESAYPELTLTPTT